jgi:hypothetical protein
VAGQDGWAPSQRDSSSHEEEFKRCLRLAGAHFQWRRANDPCWKPRGGNLTSQRPGRPSPISCCGCACDRPGSARTAATFFVLEGERVALLLADAQLVREEYAADVHYAPTARISQQDVEA